MRYLNVEQALDKNYSMTQLADLCRRGDLTPVFYYSGYLDRLDEPLDEHNSPVRIEPCKFKGYLTADDLIDTVPTKCWQARIYETLGVFTNGDAVALSAEDYSGRLMTTHDLNGHDVTLDDLLFPLEELQPPKAVSNDADLETIKVLLRLLQEPQRGFDKDNKPLPAPFPSQAKIIEAIEELNVRGLSKSSLEARFSRANKQR